MKLVKNLFTWLILPAAICLLAWINIDGIMQPVNFNKAKDARQAVAVQRLKDIRELQVAFKSVNNKFTSNLDSLVLFYNNGEMSIVMQVGSMDDSLAVAHTEAIKKKNRKITAEKLYELYKAGDKNLVFSVVSKIPVKDTLFASRENFCIDSVVYIPFSGGSKIECEAIVKQVSGVPVPLFEARIPYKELLKGLDNQLRINLDAERRDQNKYEGLQVGSIENPNNNAGNWE